MLPTLDNKNIISHRKCLLINLTLLEVFVRWPSYTFKLDRGVLSLNEPQTFHSV